MHRYMESFDSLGEFMDLDLLDHLGDAMLLNDRLLFLGTWEGGKEGGKKGGGRERESERKGRREGERYTFDFRCV